MISRLNSAEFENLSQDKKRVIEELWKPDGAVKVGKLAKDFGLNVYESNDLMAGISGEIRPINRSRDKFEINVAMFDNKARKRFTVAHEIAHFLLHKKVIGDGIQDDVLYRSRLTNKIEAEANRLAADIVMPSVRIKHAWNELGDIEEHDKLEILASRFQVSRAAIDIRQKTLGLGSSLT